MNERKIFDKLIAAGMSIAGAVGLMGNLYAESALNPKNLQNSYEKKLNRSDESYTAAVDDGSYTNFVNDAAGYGLAQWTFWTRKQALLNFAKARNTSIGDLDMQIEFMLEELKTTYAAVWKCLCSTSDVSEASNIVLFRYESPANQGISVQNFRYQQSMKYYEMFVSSTKSIQEVVQEVLAGKWGNGDERKERLTAAGYNYNEVQKAVNEFLADSKGTVEKPVENVETAQKKTIEATVNVNGKNYSGTLTEDDNSTSMFVYGDSADWTADDALSVACENYNIEFVQCS